MFARFKHCFYYILGLIAFTPIHFLLAITANNPDSSFENPIASDSLRQFLLAFLDVVLKIAFPFIILAIVYSGFLFVKAQGDPEELKTAKSAILWTVIGAILVLGSMAILDLIQGTVDEIRRP